MWQNFQESINGGKNKKYFRFRASGRVSFFSMMRPGSVVYCVYLHYISETENISVKFSFIKTWLSIV